MRGYTVFISSTDADLHDVRAVVYDSLKRRGFEVQAFDDSAFEPSPGLSAPEACVQAARNCDILLLIVDRRYGSRYRGGSLSVTETEYNTARSNARFVIPCIRLRTWMEASSREGTVVDLDAWLRRHDIPEQDWPELSVSYVGEPEVLKFVERIKNQDKDNFITFFDSSVDLERKLEGRLRAVGAELVRQFVDQSSTRVGARRIATLGTDLFGMRDLRSRGLYVDPPFVVKAGDAIHSDRLIETIRDKLSDRRASVALIGAAGSGKSTLLVQTYLAHAERYLAGDITAPPLFINLKGRGETPDQSLVAALDEQWKLYLGRELYPLIDIERLEFVAYLDSLDEIVSDPSRFDFGEFLTSAEYFGLPHLVTCREDYFRGYVLGTEQKRQYHTVIRLMPWRTKEISAFLTGYTRSSPHFNVDFALRTIEQQRLQGFASSPLLLSFIAALIDEQVDLSAMKHTVEVFEMIINRWADREAKRGSGKYSVTDLEDAWRTVAWMLLETGTGIALDDIVLVLREREILEGIAATSEFHSILQKSVAGRIHGFFHESIFEYFVAAYIFSALVSPPNIRHVSRALSIDVKHEVNYYLTGLLSQLTPDRLDDLHELLWAIYTSRLDGSDPAAHVIRNRCAYLLGRAPGRHNIDRLRLAREWEKDRFVLHSLYWAAVLQDDVLALEEYLKLLEQAPDDNIDDRMNRGYHLVYYSDMRKPATTPYLDKGGAWANTRRALLSHLQSTAENRLRIRALDLLTLRRFLGTRQGTCTAEETRILNDKSIIVPDSVSAEEKRLIESQWEKLKRQERNH